ncbi:MAG: hypothetical protein SPL99_05120 [Catonella sp.]|nr:hypothetical protein [Catonella sp.]MDY6355758.1 hypothetical protein [Catonella sp.]
MSEKYFVGLDMGTSSVGWAVTDEHYHLLRRKGKDRHVDFRCPVTV